MRLSYSELIQIPTFQERFEYLKQNQNVAEKTFGGHRWLNQRYYKSLEWKQIRDRVIIRDQGCDLAIPGHDIYGAIYVHHINPISQDDIYSRSPELFDMDNLITVSFNTHQAIHYLEHLGFEPVDRIKGDTKLW